MRGRRHISFLRGLGAVALLCAFLCCRVSAAEQDDVPHAVQDMQSGVLKMAVYLYDEASGTKYYAKQGTGILIGNESKSQNIVTSDELITVDQELRQRILRQYGLDAERTLEARADIVLPMGTSITVKVTEARRGENFAVLNLDSGIHGVPCLRLGDSAKVNQNDKIYVIGYKGKEDIFGQSSVAYDEPAQAAAIVKEESEDVLTVDYVPEDGSIGAPLFNADGHVMGIYLKKEGALFVEPIDKVKKVLDVLGVYYEGPDNSSHYNEVTDEISRELNALLLDCQEKAVQSNVYSKKTLKKLKDAIVAATKVMTENSSTYDDYVAAIENLTKVRGKLKNKEHGVRVVQVMLLLCILTFCILNLSMMHKIKLLRSESVRGLAENVNDVIYAKLVRLDSFQEIPISNVIFKIGQNVEGIDYAVENNTSVSRQHAEIMRKGTEFFIKDNNSTNHTYVNGKQIMPGDYVKIVGGDRLRLADVEFLFEV